LSPISRIILMKTEDTNMSIFELSQYDYMLIFVNTKGSTIEPLRLKGLFDSKQDQKAALGEDPWDGVK